MRRNPAGRGDAQLNIQVSLFNRLGAAYPAGGTQPRSPATECECGVKRGKSARPGPARLKLNAMAGAACIGMEFALARGRAAGFFGQESTSRRIWRRHAAPAPALAIP
jgi:hypothetical protein